MRIVSINVGFRARCSGAEDRLDVHLQGARGGTVQVKRLNVEGDRQSDLEVHGGADKAVYVYPAEHYAFWRAELPAWTFPGCIRRELHDGGLIEDSVHIGTGSGSVPPSSW